MKFFEYFNPGMTIEEVKSLYKELSKQFHPDASGTNTNHKQSGLNAEYDAICRFNEYRMGFDDYYAKAMEEALRQCQGGVESGVGGFGGPVGSFIKMAEKPLTNLANITSNVTEIFRMAFPQKPARRKTKKVKTRKEANG